MYKKVNHFSFRIKDTYEIREDNITTKNFYLIKESLSDYKFKYFNITKKNLFGEKTIHEYSFIKGGHRINIYFTGGEFLVQSIMFHQHEYSKIFAKHFKCNFEGLMYLTNYREELNII